MTAVSVTGGEATTPRFLASDNTSGMCPQALEYLHKANAMDGVSYGADEWTAQARKTMADLFETDCNVFFVFNGTAANSLSLAALCQPYQSVICHQHAHINNDECAAPGFFSSGARLLPLGGEAGRLTPEAVAAAATQRTDVHAPQPAALSLTQATEVGTVYKAEQLRALADVAHGHDMRVHMDGARLANACASLRASPADLSWRAGVDVLCFSGTKNGLALGEAVVFFDKQLAHNFAYRRKQGGQLASKMRFLSAPWLGLLETGAWLENARHANSMAQRLATGVDGIAGIGLVYAAQANTVFLNMPSAVQAALRERQWQFHNFYDPNVIRLACGWNTTPELVDMFISDVHDIADTVQVI